MTIQAVRVPDFDTWRQTFAGAQIEFLRPNTTERITIYSDPEAKTQLTQPVTLLERSIDDQNYGKFPQPIYVTESYRLRINGVDETGIAAMPLLSFDGRDVSQAQSKTQRGSRLRRLIERANDVIHAFDFGELGGSGATNTATLNAAIGAAAGQGGGFVLIPTGTFTITNLTLPENVILVGQGQAATVLQSQEAQAVVTLSGDGAGLQDLTLDGVNLNSGSEGVAGVGITAPFFRDCLIKRFEKGIELKGCDEAVWISLSVDNCEQGVNLLGDLDSGGSGEGGPVEFNQWLGGKISNCTTHGLLLQFEDQLLRNNGFRDLLLESNTGTALIIEGARYTRLENTAFSSNVKNLDIKDGLDTSQAALNTVIGFHMSGGLMSGGETIFDGTCQDVVFREMAFTDVDFTLTTPVNSVLIVDSTEDAQVTSAGETLRLQRVNSHDLEAETQGFTTDATATVAWDYRLASGAHAIVEAKVIANRRDGVGHAVYHIEQGVQRPGDELGYDALVGAFTVGEIVTGQTSGATGRIIADTGSVLTLRSVDGEFEDNETITDSATGEATVNGTLTAQAAALLGSITDVIAAVETTAGMAAVFTVSQQNVEVSITGVAAQTWDWKIRAKVMELE